MRPLKSVSRISVRPVRAITDRAVDVYVLRLRQKIETDPASPVLIHSVRGFGYTFEPRRAMAV